MAVQLLRSRTSPFLEIRTMTAFMIGLQGFLGGMTLWVIYAAIEYVPLGNGSAIFFCTPVLFDYNFFIQLANYIFEWGISLGDRLR